MLHNRFFQLVLGLVVSAASVPIGAAELPQVRPERMGMSSQRLEQVTALAERYVADGQVAGMHTMILRGGKIVYERTTGTRGVADDRPLAADALYRIFSMTKPITAVAAMMLYEQGKFQLTDHVSKFVPELKNLTMLVDGERVPVQSTMTMQQLLTHTTGLSYGFMPDDPVDQLYRDADLFQEADLDAFAAALAKLPLKYEPGAQWHYSVAVDVTGLVVQRVSGQSFDEYLREHIFEPLGMNDTFFEVPDDKLGRFLPNHQWDADAGKIQPLEGNPFARYANTTLFSGGAGLVSTTLDYMRFCEMLRNGGELDGVRLLSPKTIQYMVQDHLPAALSADGSGESPGLGIGSYNTGIGFGLGVGVVTDPAAAGVIASKGQYSWGGAAGTIFWIDPVEDLVVVSMIQLMGSPWPLRAEMMVLTNQAIVELAPL